MLKGKLRIEANKEQWVSQGMKANEAEMSRKYPRSQVSRKQSEQKEVRRGSSKYYIAFPAA
jgi:hypothetical protein